MSCAGFMPVSLASDMRCSVDRRCAGRTSCAQAPRDELRRGAMALRIPVTAPHAARREAMEVRAALLGEALHPGRERQRLDCVTRGELGDAPIGIEKVG